MKQSPTQWIRENAHKFNKQADIIRACTEATGTTFGSAKSQLYRYIHSNAKPHPITFIQSQNQITMQKQCVGISEREFREKYDLPYIIKQQADKLEKGVYLTESEFVVKCKIRAGWSYRSVLDHPDFKIYRGRARDGIIYWSHPDSIKEKKEMTFLT